MGFPHAFRQILNVALLGSLTMAFPAPLLAETTGVEGVSPDSPAPPAAVNLIYTFKGIETSDIPWLKQAAQQGYAAAQVSLARNYRQGKRVEHDLGQQLVWLTKAAKQDFDWAAYELGRVYETGEGVALSDEISRKWYRQAAQKGLVPAIRRLADLKDGDDVGKSWQKLFEKRVALDLRYFELQKSVQTGKLSDTELFAAFEKLAQDGHVTARQEVAIRKITGRGTQSNIDEGLRELTALDGEGRASATLSLGDLYLRGKFVERDLTRAVAYLRKAGEANVLRALTILASLHEQGSGVPQDLPTAHMMYRVAAEQGDQFAQARLGVLFEQGIGTGRDKERAIYWYRLAAQKNVQSAKDALARLGGTAQQASSSSTGDQVVINANSVPDLRTQALLLNIDRQCKGLSGDERELIDGLMRAEAKKQNQDADRLLADTKEQAEKISCGEGAKNLLRMGVTANLRSRYQEFRNKDAEAKYWSMLMPSRLINRRCKFFGDEKAGELDGLASQLDQRIQERVRNDPTLALAVSKVEEEFANAANKSACDAGAKRMVENAIKISNAAGKKRGQEF